MKEEALAKEKTQTTTTVHDAVNTDSELYKVGMYVTAAFAVAVGGWGLVCLSSSLLGDSSPIELLKNLFHAITGM